MAFSAELKSITASLRRCLYQPLWAALRTAGRRCLRSAQGGALACLLLTPIRVAAAEPPATIYMFHIQQQSLRDALEAFALASNHRLFYQSSIVAGMSSSPLQGRFTLAQALESLLGGTGLTYAVTSSGVVLITRQRASALSRWMTRMAATLSGLASGGAAQSARARLGPGRQPGDDGQGLDELEEVTVTATRRSEAELDVPMSIVAIPAAALRQKQANDFNGFAPGVPNLSFDYSEGGNINDRGVAIRGIQGVDTTGFYLDDLPMPISLDPRVIDLERIEVLEGPQGTLYGARSMGGTIREITTAPDLMSFSALADAQATTLDGGSGGYLGYLTLNVPFIADRLALRITPYRGQDGGWINRAWPEPSFTDPARWIEQRHTAQTGYDGLNAQLLWRPSSSLSIRPKLLYQKVAANGLPLGNFSADNTTNFMNFDIPEGTLDQFIFSGGTIDYAAPFGNFTSATSVLDRRTRDDEDVSEFTSFGYQTPLLPSPLAVFDDTHDFVQELRFTSSWHSALQFTAGLYYDSDHDSVAFNQYIAGFQALYGTPVVAALWNPTSTSQQAVYGELTWQLTRRWSLTLGERYSRDTYRAGGKLWGAIEFPAGLTYASSTASLASSEADDVVTPRYVVKYQPNENLDIYADAAKGFRPGAGQIAPGSNLCAADYAATNLTPQDLSQYGPDWVWDYELGEKAFFDNHRYSLNGSFFWINWSNIREYLLFKCGEGAQINAGQALSRGIGLQASAVPWTGLSLSAGLGYDDARVVKPGALISVPPAGSMIQEVAPVTANFSGQYQWAWGAHMQWILHFDYAYTAHRYSVANSPLYPRLVPGYALENLRLSLLRGAAEYALFVTNLGGVHPNLSDEVSQAAEAPGRPRWTEGAPSTYGLEARWSF
ncbi:MAG TPA: TonB-dependent receptor [Steroidobacteraceae bacterium]|nr:TonB-dependent receptor [Steroidobacteraceae bacterium]